MSSHNSSTSIGGVKNLRAIFENNPSEDRSASPPSRGRSPTLSETSLHSRSVSQVRASFVIVERSGEIEEGQHWGLRRASDVASMADLNQELDNAPLVNGSSNTSNAHPHINGVHSDSQPQPQQHVAEETAQGGLGSILKGSSFEISPPTAESKPQEIESGQPRSSPLTPKKALGAAKMNGALTPSGQPKSIGSRIKDAASSNHNQPPPPTKLITTKGAQPIKPPPTRQVPFSTSSAKSPTSPKTPRASLSPKTERPTTKGSAAKPLAVTESARNGASPEQRKSSSTLPTEPRRSSLNTPSPAAGRDGPSSPKTHRAKKDSTPVPPAIKPRPARLSASAAAPTTASAAKSANPTSMTRKPTTTTRNRPSAKTTVSTAPAVKKTPRTSLNAPTDVTDRTKPRISASKNAPRDGFLARMTRPTASSAQKAHEKAAPISPPQSKRAAPLRASKGRIRRSLTTSNEDKENGHRGGPEIYRSPSALEARQPEMNGDGKVESQPLNDITPTVKPDEATVFSATKEPETSRLIPGDGIGREVIPAGRRILESLPSALGLKFEFVDLDAGFDHFKAFGTALPEKTVEALQKECDGALFGAVSSPSTRVPGYTSPIVALRKRLSLYANVRPCKTVLSPAFKSPASAPIDLVIVRENTEDLYVKEEKTYADPSGEGQIAEAIKRISTKASSRIAKIAGEIALRRQKMREKGEEEKESDEARKKQAMVTITHKSNVLSQTDGLFRSTARETLSARAFSSLHIEEQIVDSMVYKLFLQPQYYDVIVAPNLYGDLLSDGAAALVGSLGLVPSANVGEGIVMGEPCHGSAPDIEGKGIANPVATIRSVACMLEFLDQIEAARAINDAVDGALGEGRFVSPDLGGKATTEQVTDDIVKRL